MPSLEIAIRLFVTGQVLLIAAVFLFGAGRRSTRVIGALLMLGVAGYLFTSNDTLRHTIPMLVPLTMLLAQSVPYCLWLFARAIFEAPWPHPGIVVVAVFVGALAWAMLLAEWSFDRAVSNTSGIVIRIVSLMIVMHALWLTLRGRPDDLIEKRRVFRLAFVTIISIQVALVLIIELVLVGETTPGWLVLTNVIVIALITIGLAIPMLRLSTDFFELPDEGTTAVEHQVPGGLGAAGPVYREKLLQLMDDGYYRTTGLTITQLAARLGYPEHQLRRLINGHLGYRNFSSFLNSYRLDEARKRLADPERAREPVLTIALDLGYASLGPFNRAFKASTGVTPTDFRRRELSRNSADSE